MRTGNCKSGRAAERRDHLHDVGRADVGDHDRLRHVHDDVDLVDVLELHDRLLRPDVLPLLDEPLGDHAVVGRAQRGILELDVRFDHAAFEPANLGLLGLDVLLAGNGSLLEDLEGGLVIFLGHAVGGFSALEIGARDGIRAHQPRVALKFRPGVREPRLGRPHLRFPAQPLLGSFPLPQRPEGGPSLVELALHGLQSGLKFILPELGDQVAFGDVLSLLDRQSDQQTGYLEGELDAFRPFDPSREGAYMSFIPGDHDHRFHGANHL